jgi:uncharacterized delta-60 repeat protein
MIRKTLFLVSFFFIFHYATAQTMVLDNTFGAGGIVTIAFDSLNAVATDAVVQSDGKIIVVGCKNCNCGDCDSAEWLVIRLHADGNIDSSFGNNGFAITAFGPSISSASANAVALQPDGNIVVGGSVEYTTFSNLDWAICRYDTNGIPDTTFGLNGIVTKDFGSWAEGINDIMVLPGGKLLAGGAARTMIGFGYDMTVGKFNSDGTIDTTFGAGGVSFVPFVSLSMIASIGLQSNGKIIGAGHRTTQVMAGDFFYAAFRLNSNGSIDSTFAMDGRFDDGFGGLNDLAEAMIIQNDDKIIIVGESDLNEWSGGIIRTDTNGLQDVTFGMNGKVREDFGYEMSDEYKSVLLLSDGRILAAGEAQIPSGNTDFAFVLFHPNGTIDSSFGTNGRFESVINGYDNLLQSLFQPDGKLLAIGFTYPSHYSTKSQWVIARYTGLAIGISQPNSSESTMLIYPNPANRRINLQIPQQFGQTKTLEVFDCFGQKQFEKTNDFTEIDISSLTSGLYFIVLTNKDNERQTIKIIKE